MRTDIPDDWDEAPPEPEPPAVDFEVDPLVVHEEAEQIEEPDVDLEADEEAEIAEDETETTVIDPELDDAVVSFVELLNARDMEALAEMLAEDAEAMFLGETSPSGVIESLEDLVFRHPDLVVTRGDLGPEPVVAVWLLDADTDHYRFAGIITLELAETGGLIRCLQHIEEPPADDLVVEVPDDSERPEWEDWAAQDET